jgi:hypothetical protein
MIIGRRQPGQMQTYYIASQIKCDDQS